MGSSLAHSTLSVAIFLIDAFLFPHRTARVVTVHLGEVGLCDQSALAAFRDLSLMSAWLIEPSMTLLGWSTQGCSISSQIWGVARHPLDESVSTKTTFFRFSHSDSPDCLNAPKLLEV